MAEDASAERVKAVEGDEETHEEYIYFLNKIKKLYKDKMKLLVLRDVLPKKVVKPETKKFKRPITTQQKKKKKKPVIKLTRMPLVSNQVTEQLKQFIANEINGEEVKVVIQKRLYESDLKENQNRLNIPINQLQTHDFLTEHEKRDLMNGLGLEVDLLGPRLWMHEKPMVLKIWHLKSSDNYVLIRNWNEFVKENEEDLKENTMIQLWSFRRHNQLCFAIVCLDTNVGGQNDVNAASPVADSGILPSGGIRNAI